MKNLASPQKPKPLFNTGALKLLGVTVGLLFALNIGACRTLVGAPPPAVPVPVDPDADTSSGDAETGMKHLTNLLKRFHAALYGKDFPEADRLLKLAENGTQQASEMTRSHPDFEDTAAAVAAARPRYVNAVEADRIERRNAAIDTLMTRGTQAVEEDATLLTEVAAHVPQEGDTGRLSDAIEALSALHREGEGFLDEPRFRQHATTVEQALHALTAAQARATGQLQLMAAIKPAIEKGIAAVGQAKQATTPPTQLTAYNAVAANFAQCVAAFNRLDSAPGYDASVPLETPLGQLTAAATRAQCTNLTKQAVERAKYYGWESEVATLVNQIKEAMTAVTDAKTPEETVAQSKLATQTLKDCEGNTRIVSPGLGMDPTQRFKTALGNLTAPELVRACGKSADKLQADIPAMRWRAQALAMLPRLLEVQGHMASATQSTDQTKQVAEWSAAVGGLQECVERLAHLAEVPGAIPNMRLETVFGTMTVTALAHACTQEKSKAEKNLAQSLSRVEAGKFLASCQGDEIDVVQREGSPNRIDTVPQGRIFVYDPKEAGALPRHYGFNAQGKRVDFWVAWRTSVQQLHDELQKALPATHADGHAGLTASDAVAPLLEACIELVDGSGHNPGFDITAQFDSAFGKLSANALGKACSKELQRIKGRLRQLEWQNRLEALRDRADAAATLLDKVSSANSPHTQADMLSEALGGFQECTERGDALTKQQAFDHKYKVQSSAFGRLGVTDLQKACKKAHGRADERLQLALAAARQEDFVASCHGDEAEVARREGIPPKIDPVGTHGRIFIYGAGAKQHRFAFDADGKRVQEEALRAKKQAK